MPGSKAKLRPLALIVESDATIRLQAKTELSDAGFRCQTAGDAAGALALAADAGAGGSTSSLALKLVAEEIGVGLAVGAGFTVLATWLLKRFSSRGWITETWRQLPVVALALVCFAVAQLLNYFEV